MTSTNPRVCNTRPNNPHSIHSNDLVWSEINTSRNGLSQHSILHILYCLSAITNGCVKYAFSQLAIMVHQSIILCTSSSVYNQRDEDSGKRCHRGDLRRCYTWRGVNPPPSSPSWRLCTCTNENMAEVSALPLTLACPLTLPD
jgi:hypothetical protein